MTRAAARVVVFFFLSNAAIDICNPCPEKLESVGVLPDHCQAPINDETHGLPLPPERSERSPHRKPPADDDCFCCRRDVVVESMAARFGNAEYHQLFLFPESPVLASSIPGILPQSLPFPTCDGRLETDFKPPKPAQRLRAVLSADLLPPPVSHSRSESLSRIRI